MKENSRCLDAKVESCNLRTVISFRVTPRSLDAGHVLPQKGHDFAMLDSVVLQLPLQLRLSIENCPTVANVHKICKHVVSKSLMTSLWFQKIACFA